MAQNSLQELVNDVEGFLSQPDESFSDAPAVCASLLARLDHAVPDIEFSDRHLRRLKSRLRVRQNQFASNTSGERSDQGDEDPSSSLAEPATDPPAYQEISSDITLLRAKIDALRHQHSPSPSGSHRFGSSGDALTGGLFPPFSPVSGLSGDIQTQNKTATPPLLHCRETYSRIVVPPPPTLPCLVRREMPRLGGLPWPLHFPPLLAPKPPPPFLGCAGTSRRGHPLSHNHKTPPL